jgi:hypothetical protein
MRGGSLFSLILWIIKVSPEKEGESIDQRFFPQGGKDPLLEGRGHFVRCLSLYEDEH